MHTCFPVTSRMRPGTSAAVLLLVGASAFAVPEFVEHHPQTPVYGEAAGVTMREPDAPRDGEAIDVWARIGYSFWYTDVAVYYTTDGSDPAGSRGTPSGTTAVLTSAAGQVVFVRNEPHTPNIDWWKAVLPASTRAHGTTVRYRIGAWHAGGGIEVFANNTGCGDGTCDDPAAPQAIFSYTVRLAWPGRGYPHASPGEGFPGIHHWKEEAVVGNNYMNVMLDANGTIYDVYFPSAGCVQGVAARNEGYVDGPDTFPPGLPPGFRGQMHVNQVQAGLRIDGTTYWLSNEGGAYTGHQQAYVPDTNVVRSVSTLTHNGYGIVVEQYDLCPRGIAWPTDGGGQPVRALQVKRILLTNQGPATRTIDFYCNADFALNGGDGYDAMFADPTRGAMVGYDNTGRTVSGTGNGTSWPPGEEYNPTSFGSYSKNVSVYLAAAVKLCDTVGSASGTPATDSWRDSSPDNAAGWVGLRLTLDPGQTRELDVAVAGGFDAFPGATGTYGWFIAPALDWFHATSMAAVQSATEAYWTTWLASGTDVDFPDDAYDALYRRSLLATALHCDAAGGGVIAGMHNGAYPYVWPRDALYAAVTLDRTGHFFEAGEVFRFLRDVAWRADDAWGKGFWFQKYTTDGYHVWTAPQVDETANVPWAGWYHYLATGDLGFLNGCYTMFYEASRAMSEDSGIDARLFYDETHRLMHGNNVWEDAFDEFIYSNAAVERGLRDAARIAAATGRPADAALFNARAGDIHDGLNGRLDWNGENTDISQLGIVWPFETHAPTDPRAVRVIDRINGTAVDRWGNSHPLVNGTGQWQDLINRYWNDTYWWNAGGPNPSGSPWFLTTLWYGQYYARRQDLTPGKADIDNHKHRIDRTRAFLGPTGLGAEQMAPLNSLLYPGQADFRLQAAWPNAWESMSFLVDCLMLFLDHVPDAPNDRIFLAPKLPGGWNTMTFRNLRIGPARAIDVTCTESPTAASQVFTNRNGGTVHYDTWVRLPAVAVVTSVRQDGVPAAWTPDAAASRVRVTGTLNPAAASATVLAVTFNDIRGDFDHDGDIDAVDFDHFAACAAGPGVAQADPDCADARLDGDGDIDVDDFALFQRCIAATAALADPACDDGP